jgi:crotonobetainyl-CoA:carnitine CoA-transferase CaiB-like acyl-CoA transferase
MESTPKRLGRPPKAGGAKSPAARQWEYRQRLDKASTEATLKPGTATTAALLASLKRHCKSIDTVPDHAAIARRLAAPVIRELCDRYKIKLT